jgi:hypothetical protein
MKQAKSPRPKLPPVSEQMKAWSASLAGEIGGWTEIATRAFFGFTALYCQDSIFALLPLTRGIKTAHSLAFKLRPLTQPPRSPRKDSRIGSTEMQKARWFTFELASDSDLHEVLEWLQWVYRAAAKRQPSGSSGSWAGL